jgi:hypothetical protein
MFYFSFINFNHLLFLVILKALFSQLLILSSITLNFQFSYFSRLVTRKRTQPNNPTLSNTPIDPAKGSIVALPEMFATGFSMNTGEIAEEYGGPTEQFLAQTAREWGIYLVAGAAMRGRDGRVRNKALVFFA